MLNKIDLEVGSLRGETTTSFASLAHDISLLSGEWSQSILDEDDQNSIIAGNLSATGQLLLGKIDTVSGDLISVSGEATTSFASLSHDISLVEEKIALIGSLPIPVGVDNLSVLFTTIFPSAYFTSPPHVMVTARYSPSTPYIYGMTYHSVTNTGVSVDFSATILEPGHYLDYSLRG